MLSRLAAVLDLRGIPRRSDLDDRSTVLVLFARFTDELCSGLLVVLMPTIRARLGLSLAQVGLAFQAMVTVGALVEPMVGLAIDVTRRRPLLVAGAAAWGGAMLLAAGATGPAWVVAAFALIGAAYAPLASTADVVLIEAHPDAPERIQSRSTVLDTTGALLAPAAVAAAGWSGVDHRLLLTVTGLAAAGYALSLATTVLPAPPPRPAGGTTPGRGWVRRLVAPLRDPVTRRLVGGLVALEVLEVPDLFEPVWVRDVVGASQAQVAVHAAVGITASLVALVWLDRWLARRPAGATLVVAALATVLLHPVWLLVGGYRSKLVLVALREAAAAPLWPILQARALASAPGRAGAVTALVSLVGLLPLQAGTGWLAGRFGLTPTLLVVHLVAATVLLGLVSRQPTRPAVAGR